MKIKCEEIVHLPIGNIDMYGVCGDSIKRILIMHIVLSIVPMSTHCTGGIAISARCAEYNTREYII